MNVAGSRTVDIDAPPERIWAMIADITAMGRWSPITPTAAWIPPADGPAVGARFTGTNRLPIVRRWTSTCTVTAAEAGRWFAFAVGNDPADPNTTWTYQLTPTVTGATTVTGPGSCTANPPSSAPTTSSSARPTASPPASRPPSPDSRPPPKPIATISGPTNRGALDDRPRRPRLSRRRR